MKGWLAGIVGLMLSFDFCAGITQEERDLSIAQRIAAVEEHLLPRSSDDPSEVGAKGFIDRMRFHRVPAL
jgi:hypothetical protein